MSINIDSITVFKRIKITGADTVTTPYYTVEQMNYMVVHIGDVKSLKTICISQYTPCIL